MYFSNITDNELVQFKQMVGLTASYNELYALGSNLFDVSQRNKLIPLFYSDTIDGYSEKLTIVDDLLVLYMDETVEGVTVNDLDKLYFSSADENREFDVLHEIVTVNGKFFLKLHFFDNVSLFNLSDFRFHISQSDDGVNQDFVTDNYGNCIVPLVSNFGVFTVTSNNTIISWSE